MLLKHDIFIYSLMVTNGKVLQLLILEKPVFCETFELLWQNSASQIREMHSYETRGLPCIHAETRYDIYSLRSPYSLK